MTNGVPLYERIRQRCLEEDRRFLDCSSTSPLVSQGSELIDLAERIAAYLVAHLSGHRVVVCLDQCSTFLPVFWGCLRAGLTAVPVSLAATGGRARAREIEEFRQLLEQAGPVAVVVDEQTAGLQGLLPADPGLLWLPFSRLITAAVSPQAWERSSADVAFVLQTSGTTGECKYAAFSGDWYDYEVGNSHRVLTLFPLASSSGVGCVYARSRLSAYLPLREAVRDPDRLLAVIEAHQIEILAIPPVMVSVLLRYLGTASAPLVRRDLSSLIKLNIGSSSIPLEAVEKLDRLLQLWGAPEHLFHFAYGLTETGVVAYGPYRDVAGHRHVQGLRIGPISPAVKVRISAERAGEPGEILVQRPYTFLGYLEGGAEGGWSLSSFRSGSDWFATGDLGVVDGDGLVLTGRLKDTIVLNSCKISLAAIERFVVETTPDLFEVVVACAAPQEELVLCVVLTPEATSLPVAQLQAEIAQSIQREFGLPLRHWVVSEADDIPRTATGKVRKGDLVNGLMDRSHEVDATSMETQASSSVEEHLLNAIREQATVFRAPDSSQPVSGHGIDSLALAQIIGSVERASGLRCRLEACPPDPTIRQLAALFAQPMDSLGNQFTALRAPPEHEPLSVDLGQFPHRAALSHRIQAANVQLGGESLGPERVVRLFNSKASAVPVILVGQLSGDFVAGLATDLADHPIYYLRVVHDYASEVNREYLACCYLDWLESCLPECHPVVVGFCLASRLALDLSRHLWRRRHAPRLTMLMNWNVGKYRGCDPYPGSVLYHIHEHYHGGLEQKRQEILEGLKRITPSLLMAYWAKRRIQGSGEYIDWVETRQSLLKLMQHPVVQRRLALP